MTTRRSTRRIPAIAGAAAIIALVGLSAACAKEEEKAPETTTTTTTTTTTPAPTPTEKAPRIDPGGPNPFSPSVGTAGADGSSGRQLADRGARLANRRRAPTAGVDRAVGVLVLASDLRITQVPNAPASIGGPLRVARRLNRSRTLAPR